MDQEPAHLVPVARRLVLQVHHAGRQIHARIREVVQEMRDFVYVPLERSQMHAVEVQGRVRCQHAVARRELLCVRGDLGMLVHIVLAMLAKIVPVALDRHLLVGQPAVQRFALVTQQHNVAMLQVIDDRSDARIVDHHVPAVRIAQAHADVFPYLHADGTLRHGGVEPANLAR